MLGATNVQLLIYQQKGLGRYYRSKYMLHSQQQLFLCLELCLTPLSLHSLKPGACVSLFCLTILSCSSISLFRLTILSHFSVSQVCLTLPFHNSVSLFPLALPSHNSVLLFPSVSHFCLTRFTTWLVFLSHCVEVYRRNMCDKRSIVVVFWFLFELCRRKMQKLVTVSAQRLIGALNSLNRTVKRA